MYVGQSCMDNGKSDVDSSLCVGADFVINILVFSMCPAQRGEGPTLCESIESPNVKCSTLHDSIGLGAPP